MLNDEWRRFHFVLTEQAVRLKRAPAPVMADQLRHLASVAERPNTDVAILPSSTLVEASPLNIFVIYDERLVTVETFAGSVVLRDYRDISYHLNVFEHFRARSLAGDDVREFLDSAAEEFMRGRG